MAGRWRRNLSDATWLFALPLVAALLPWRWGFALLRRVARGGHGFGDIVAAAWQQARDERPDLDEQLFRYRYRLLLLVDRCDNYLTLLRSVRWWRRHVDVTGDGLPALHVGLLLFSHWGAGHWIWRILVGEGMTAYLLARRAAVGDVGRGRVSGWYMHLRIWGLHRGGCAGPIFAGGSKDQLREVLARGDSVLAAVDLPAAPQQRAVPVTLLGHPTRFPSALIELALDANVAISLAAFGLDWNTGRRSLHLEALPRGLTVQEIMSRYAAYVSRCIEAQPAAWQVWPQAPTYWNGG